MTDPNRLLDRYLDGQLSPDELSQLERDLASNTKYADAFAAAMMIDTLLEDRFERETIATAMQLQDGSFLGNEDLRVLQDDYDHAVADTVTIVDLSNKRFPAAKDANSITASQAVSVLSYEFKQLVRTNPKPFIMSALAAAAVLLLALILFNPFASDAPDTIATLPDDLFPPVDVPAATPTSVVATLSAEHDAQWQGASGTALPGVGDGLQAGDRLVLTAGTAEITTTDGAVAILQAPATIELLDNNALHLHAGKLVGICETDSSQGFLVRTPHMDVTDLGTRFGVEVMPYRSTEVHVHQGEVVVETKTTTTAQSTRQHLTTNQAVRSNASNNTIASITPDFAKFDESLRTYLLPGTGFGLAEGDADLNWQIVADANGPLDTPIQVKVQYTDSSHWDAIGNDPAVAQTLIFVNGYPEYNFPKYKDLATPSVTLRSTFELPETVALDSAALRLVYASNNGMRALRINGQVVEPLAKQNNGGIRDNTRHAATLPVDQTGLKHGSNVIEVELENKYSGPVNWYLFWEIQQADGPIQPTNELIPIPE